MMEGYTWCRVRCVTGVWRRLVMGDEQEICAWEKNEMGDEQLKARSFAGKRNMPGEKSSSTVNWPE